MLPGENLDARGLFDRQEWRDVARKLRPDWSEAEFDAAWEEAAETRRRRRLN